MASTTATTVSIAIDFLVIHHKSLALHDTDDPIAHICNTMRRHSIPVTYDAQCPPTRTWSLMPRVSSACPVDIPPTHTLTPTILYSRVLDTHSSNLHAEIIAITTILDLLRDQHFIFLTSKDCRLRVTLDNPYEAVPPSALLNVSMLTTAFERCFDTLLTTDSIKASYHARRCSYDLNTQLHRLCQARDLTELRHLLHAGTDTANRMLTINDENSITFGNYPSTTDPQEIIAYTSFVSCIWDWCLRADFSRDVAPLVEGGMYDPTFSMLELMEAVGVGDEVVEFFRPRLVAVIGRGTGADAGTDIDRCRSKEKTIRGELQAQEISSVNTRNLELTNTLKRLQAEKIRSRDPRAVGRADEWKFEGGGYGVDFLAHIGNCGLSWRGQELEAVEVGGEMGLVAESIERDTEEEVQLASESNQLSVANWALERFGLSDLDEEETISYETTPELESGESSSRGSSPTAGWDMKQLGVALPSIITRANAVRLKNGWWKEQNAPVAGWNFDWESLGGPVHFH